MRLIPVVLVLTLLSVPQRTTKESIPLPSAEFPPQDSTLAFSVNAGFERATAAKLLREAPGTVEALRALAKTPDVAGTLQTLRVIVDRHPERLADAFEVFRESGSIDVRGDSEIARRNQQTMVGIIADGRRKLKLLPLEDAARAERMFILLEPREYDERDPLRALRQFVHEYRGTQTALRAEVELIAFGRPMKQELDDLDVFIAQHPGTAAAAYALYVKGFQFHTINTIGSIYPRDADPIDRFRQVQAVVRELESGRYPASEGVEKAPTLIAEFFIPNDAKMAPESIDAMISAFQQFAASRFELSDRWPPDSDGIGYLITGKIGDLYEQKGERVAGIERTLDALERTVKDPSGVRLLRGIFYLSSHERDESAAARTARLEKARGALRSLAGEGKTVHHRRALATLAALDFVEGKYPEARNALQRYVKAYPASSWTWVAALRIGQCEEALGNPGAAAQAYLDAARAHADMPLARVLGAAYAGRVFELTGDLRKALVQHERALAGWDNGYGLSYSTYVRRASNREDPFELPVYEDVVQKDLLQLRIAEVKRALSVPGGVMLERGRALLKRERYDEAAREFAELLKEHPNSPIAGEARQLMHRTQLETALRLADVERAGSDSAKAMAIVDALAKENHDFAVTAAKIMKATLLLNRGEAASAESTLAAALAEWHERQPLKSASNPVEEDVAAIRRTLFLPLGSEIYNGAWNAHAWPAAPPPYFAVNSQTAVKRHDDEVTRITITEPLPQAGKVLFFDAEQIALLQKMIPILGGTRRREPQAVIETPNQPIGDSMQILALWKKFFPARPGHWGGWELEAYPVITEIHFTNAERTKASVKVTIGYSGATVEMEKDGGKWVARRLTNRWIT